VLIVNDPAYMPFIASDDGVMVIEDQPCALALPHFAMGEALPDVGLQADALTHFRIALAIDPKNPRMRKRIGMELFAAGRLEDAQARLREVRALGASDANVEATLAEIARRLARVE
jgi:Flp pilus assembly protein TadD, contains TPR repeats